MKTLLTLLCIFCIAAPAVHSQNTFPSTSYGGNVLSQYSANTGASYGFFTAKQNNHFTQNAFYDGGWKSYGSKATYGSAIILQTNGFGGHAFLVFADNDITGANESLSFSPLMSVKTAGEVGIGTMSSDAKLQIINENQDSGGNTLILGPINQSNLRLGYHQDYSWVQSHGGKPLVLNEFGNNVAIGTTSPSPGYKLTVKGGIHAEEVKVDLNVPGPDYVFESDYPLSSLEDTKAYIEQNKHLPGIPSSDEMQQNGVNLLEMNMKLLEKVEELTLYVIEQNRRIETMILENSKQQMEIDNLKSAKK
jgi:hypothetical protein